MWRKILLLVMMMGVAASCGGGSGSDSSSSDDEPGRPGEAADGVPYPDAGGNESVRGEFNFARILRDRAEGKAKSMPWAGYWWPYVEDGTSDALAKYARSGGSSRALDWELGRHGSATRGVESWWGHCNGWAVASVLYPEPRAAKTVSGTSFDPAEQKALLSEIGMEVEADFFGQREDAGAVSSAFDDVFPNQFLLVLTNFTGRGEPLIIDRYTGDQVWNHPVAGYRILPVKPSDVVGTHSYAPSTHRVMVSTQIWWARDDVPGGHLSEPFAFADSDSYQSRVLRFELWLDGPVEFSSSGEVKRSGDVVLVRQGSVTLGGAWMNQGLSVVDSYPDYMWVPHRVIPSSGYSNPHLDIGWVERAFGG